MHEHRFTPSDKPGYEVCECGTYHSTQLADPKKFYGSNYWTPGAGHSTLEEQIWNVANDPFDGVTKIEKIMSLMETKGSMLEIGCAPGVLLSRMRRKGYDVWGIEPDPQVVKEVVDVSGCESSRIVTGFFPDVELPDMKFDYVVAMDVLEHIEDYKVFVTAADKLIKDGGKFICMSPIIFNGDYRERDFCAHEHAWIFSFEYITQYFLTVFKNWYFTKWQTGHEVIVGMKF